MVLNRSEATIPSGEQELDVANALLSLGDSLESTLDTIDDNADLMPVGGGTNAPIDVAPEPLRLDQISVDAAIAGIVQSEELPSVPSAPDTKSTEDPSVDKPDDAPKTSTTQDADPDDDLPLSSVRKQLGNSKSPVKGTLKTKTYGLKKKPDSNGLSNVPRVKPGNLPSKN